MVLHSLSLVEEPLTLLLLSFPFLSLRFRSFCLSDSLTIHFSFQVDLLQCAINPWTIPRNRRLTADHGTVTVYPQTMANQSILRISRVRAAFMGSIQDVVNTKSRRSSSYRAVRICVSADKGGAWLFWSGPC